MKPIQKQRSQIFLLIILVILIVSIKVISLNSLWIERFYATGFFKGFSVFLRTITGWFSFSIGDIIYLAAGAWLLYKVFRFIVKLFRKQITLGVFGKSLVRLLFILIFIYIIFNIFWGLNYNRKGIAFQLGLTSAPYDTNDLKNPQWLNEKKLDDIKDLENIQSLLLQKINESKRALINNHSGYPSNKELFSRAAACYRECERQYPFLRYSSQSIKSSMYGWWGNYLGFSGYYNPFTGEAQVNTTVPKFVLPYTTTHEMAHQLGYAREDEANFVGYIAAASSTDTLFHYSVYLDLFIYANRAVYFVDSTEAKKAAGQLLPEIKTDIKEWRDFLKNHRSPLEPIINWAYGRYLKANQQPKGLATYNEVIGNLIAFYKKYGKI